MRLIKEISLTIAGVGLLSAAIVGTLRSCNNYQIDNPRFTSISRATGYFQFTNKIEYTRLSDGSEEIVVRDGDRMYRFQNFDGNNTTDRIRIDKFPIRDVFNLENIFVRGSDYSSNQDVFDAADELLRMERQRYSKLSNS